MGGRGPCCDFYLIDQVCKSCHRVLNNDRPETVKFYRSYIYCPWTMEEGYVPPPDDHGGIYDIRGVEFQGCAPDEGFNIVGTIVRYHTAQDLKCSYCRNGDAGFWLRYEGTGRNRPDCEYPLFVYDINKPLPADKTGFPWEHPIRKVDYGPHSWYLGGEEEWPAVSPNYKNEFQILEDAREDEDSDEEDHF